MLRKKHKNAIVYFRYLFLFFLRAVSTLSIHFLLFRLVLIFRISGRDEPMLLYAVKYFPKIPHKWKSKILWHGYILDPVL